MAFDRLAYMREYRQTEAYKESQRRYRARPEVKEAGRARALEYRHANIDRVRGQQRELRRRQWAEDPDRMRDEQRTRKRQKLYGLSPADYAERLVAQGGACAVCRRPETVTSPRGGHVLPLAVDHDHASGVARGLVCARCNKALGLLRDDPDVAAGAAAYLRSWSV